jgi:hypothetical protein
LVRLCGTAVAGRRDVGESPLRRVSTLLALSVAGVLACALQGVLFAGVAQAEAPKLVPYGSFSANVENAIGVAVDNSGLTFAGDVYVSSIYNQGEPTIYKFTPAGKSITPSPFGEPFDLSASLAVNPSNGDLYALGAFGSITIYDPSSGATIESFPVTLTPGPGGLFEFFSKPPQVGVDSAGDVFVPNAVENEVFEYPPGGCESAAPPCPRVFTGGSGSGALKGPTGVAVDASGNLWVANQGNNRIVELDSSGAPVEVNGKPVEVRSEGVKSVELYGHNDLLAIVKNSEDFCGVVKEPCSHLVEYGPTGAKLADIGAGLYESGEQGSAVAPLVAVNESDGRVYVTDGTHKKVWIYGPPQPPVSSKELSAEVTTSEVKLGALINPGGIQTTYRFEYLTEAEFQSNGRSFSGVHHAIVVPFPEGSVGEGVTPRAVWAAASGLEAGTTYHYRVVAANELGEVVGADQTFTTLTAVQAACPNEELRGGFSARLPDCRAYELVTQPTRTAIETREGGEFAANGDAVAYKTNDPLPEAPTGSYYYLARRGAGGWSSEDVIPLESYASPTCTGYQEGPLAYLAATFSSAVIEYGIASRASTTPQPLENQSCNAEGLQVVPGEPVGYRNLLLRDNATGSYRLINAPPTGVTPADARLKGASADLSHVVFTERAPLAQGAAYGEEDLYEWDEGALRVLSVLPDGTPVVGASLPEARAGDNAISAEGSHIVFTYGGGLYDRIDGQRTVRIDEKQGGSGPSGGGSFQAATTDGSTVFFLDTSKLTAGSTAEETTGEPDLYECEIVEVEEAGEKKSKCELSDLTVAKGSGHADVIRVSVLGSGESSYVYFTARGVLAGNKREYTDSEGNVVVESAQAGQNNLYMWSGGTTTFVASGATTGYEELYGLGQVSPDGTWLAFGTGKSLTGYDNTPASGAPVEEVFLYSAASNQIVCASCNPSGEAPESGGANIANISSARAPRYLSDGGRLFFETPEALVPSDTNGRMDVYEYEEGHLYLISSGTSSRESTFLGASEGGHDVFFRSSQALLPQDTQEGMDAIYDARADGGFPAPVSPQPCATADACRAPVSPQPLIYGAPSSQTFSGVGNLAPPSAVKPKKKAKPKPEMCKKRFVKKKAKCVKRPGKARKSAHANRRTGK